MILENIILKAWEDRSNINKNSDKTIISAINETLEKLDEKIGFRSWASEQKL